MVDNVIQCTVVGMMSLTPSAAEAMGGQIVNFSLIILLHNNNNNNTETNLAIIN